MPGFYERLGCRAVSNRFVNSRGARPQVRPFWDDHVMVYPAGADWPGGTIDTLGPGW